MAKRKAIASAASVDDTPLETLRDKSKRLDIQIEGARTEGQTIDADIEKYTTQFEKHSKVYDQYRAIQSLADNSEAQFENAVERFREKLKRTTTEMKKEAAKVIGTVEGFNKTRQSNNEPGWTDIGTELIMLSVEDSEAALNGSISVVPEK